MGMTNPIKTWDISSRYLKISKAQLYRYSIAIVWFYRHIYLPIQQILRVDIAFGRHLDEQEINNRYLRTKPLESKRLSNGCVRNVLVSVGRGSNEKIDEFLWKMYQIPSEQSVLIIGSL